jgi:hypothetical protein
MFMMLSVVAEGFLYLVGSDDGWDEGGEEEVEVPCKEG